MTTYNPSGIKVTVPYVNLSVSPSSASLGDDITLTLTTGESGACVDFAYSFNGGSMIRLNSGAACPYQTDSNGQALVKVNAAKEGTYTFYGEYGGIYTNGVNVNVNAPTVQLYVENAKQSAGSTFNFYAIVTDQSGNPMSGIAVSFEDLTTGVMPTGSGNPATTGSGGVAYFSHSLGCSTAWLGFSCNYTWQAFIIVGANNVSVTSNKVTVTAT